MKLQAQASRPSTNLTRPRRFGLSSAFVRARLLASLAVAPLIGCPEHDHPHSEHHTPEHEAEHAHKDEHAHGHGEPKDERPTEVVTLYQSGLELFMEYPAFVVGQPSKLIAHFTSTQNANAFAAITEGRVTAKLGDEEFVAAAPVRAGVFASVVTPSRAGELPFSLRLDGQQATGTVLVGQVKVFETSAAAKAAKTAQAEEPDTEPTISFLKEAQWQTDYATALAEPRVMRGGVYANGKLAAVPGKSAELSAPVRGRLVALGPVPHVGMKVTAGQRLVEVAPLGAAMADDPVKVDLAREEARAELARAQREHDRIVSLVQAKAIPAKRLNEAKSTLEVADARARAAGRRSAALRSTQGGGAVASRFALTSPIDGEIAFAKITPGAVVGAGDRLISVVETDRLWLEAKIYEDDAVKVNDAPGAAFSVSGIEQTFETETLGGTRVAVGPVVDEISRTVPLIFAIDNPDRLLKPGMFAKVTVYTGDTVKGIAVPEGALVDDAGHPSVFVMKDGETFARRRVRPGVKNAGFVQISSGLERGERVVSRGAYEIKLSASAGAAPAHGHAH